MRDCLYRGESPYASHKLFDGILDDTNPRERQMGIAAGQEWFKQGEEARVYVDKGVSPGMVDDIDVCTRLGILYERRSIYTGEGGE